MATSTTITIASAPQQVQVKLFTRHPEIAVPSAPLLVPVSLKRYGLSQVVNHLLETSRPIPFDFLVDGTFLRTSLDDYLTQNGLSSESTITLEYVRSILPPLHLASFQHDDWVSSVSITPPPKTSAEVSRQARIVTGSYDGISRIWNLSGQVLAEATSHTAAIKAVEWVSRRKFLTSGMDRTVRLWSYQEPEEGTGTVTPLAEYLGHKSTVEDIAICSETDQFLTASADGTVGLWSTLEANSPLPPTIPVPTQRQSKRRKAHTNNDCSRRGPLSLLQGHTSPVSSTIFDPKDPTVAYSVSWDHTIRTFDLTTSTLVDTRTTQHPLLSICSLPSLSLLACGSSARHITLHDPRANAATISTATLRGHTNAVVALAQSPESEFLMVSASHDGFVRVWDVRASGGAGTSTGSSGGGNSGMGGSVYTIKRESGEVGKKVFDVAWSKEVGIVSAGEDKMVQINTGVNMGSAGRDAGGLGETTGGGDQMDIEK